MSRSVALAVLLLPSLAGAQQAIVTLPSADITPEGKLFFMHETQVRPWGEEMWNTTHFFTAGLGSGLEAAATLFNAGVPDTGNRTLALGYKGTFALFDEHEWARARSLSLTQGASALVSFDGRGVGHWLYAHVNGRLPLVDTRLALGLSHGDRQLFGLPDQLSLIASAEQPIPGVYGLNLVAEWFGGAHDLGNLIVGATWHPNPTWIFVAGYKIPTQDRRIYVGEQALVFEVGLFF